MPKISNIEADAERLFALIVNCAENDKRAPAVKRIKNGYSLYVRLEESGRIKLENYGKNWRVVEILVGPHKGKRTRGFNSRSDHREVCLDVRKAALMLP